MKQLHIKTIILSIILFSCQQNYEVNKEPIQVDKSKIEVKAITKDTVTDSIKVNHEVLDSQVKEAGKQVEMLKESGNGIQ